MLLWQGQLIFTYINSEKISQPLLVQEYLWTLECNLDSSPFPSCSYKIHNPRHSSMYAISGNNSTLEVPSPAAKQGSCSSLVSDSGSSCPNSKQQSKVEKKSSKDKRRHSLTTSFNKLLHL